MKVGFEQATIKIENEATFGELKASIDRALAAATVEKFLKRLKSKGIRIRDFDSVLGKQVIEAVDSSLQQAGKTAKSLYGGLSEALIHQVHHAAILRSANHTPRGLHHLL